MAKSNLSHEPVPTANAMAVTAAALFVVCRAAFAVVPDLAMQVARSWFHSVDISQVSAWSLTTESFILGLVTITVGAWLVGFLFATFYTFFARR